MQIADIIGPFITFLFVLVLVLERWIPREIMPAVRGWHWLGIVFFAANAAINIGLPLLLPMHFIATHSVLPGMRLGPIGGFVVGFLVWEFVYYWFHRAEHRFDLLWRLVHQMHHSPHRVDVAGFAFSHPFDLAAATLLNTVVSVGVLGLHPQAAAMVGLYVAVAALMQHANLRTPRYLEWLMQRPEAHARHHEYGQHAGNYADWPMLDKLFGTYRAPASQPLRYGFDDRATRRMPAMLAGVDVNREIEALQHHE